MLIGEAGWVLLFTLFLCFLIAKGECLCVIYLKIWWEMANCSLMLNNFESVFIFPLLSWFYFWVWAWRTFQSVGIVKFHEIPPYCALGGAMLCWHTNDEHLKLVFCISFCTCTMIVLIWGKGSTCVHGESS